MQSDFTSSKRFTAALALALTFGLASVLGLSGCTDSMPTQGQEELPSKSGQGISANHELAPSGPVPNEITWGNGELWELLAPHEITGVGEMDLSPPSSPETPAAHPSHRPLYVVATHPTDEHSPQSSGHGGGAGEHDHVVPVPPQNRGSYTAEWHVWLVLDTSELPPEPDPTLSDDLYGPATSVEEVEQAIEDGDAVLVDTEFVFTCPIRPHDGS